MASKENEKFLLNRLKAMYGADFDPIIKIAENAKRLQNLIDQGNTDAVNLVEANKEWERMAQFTHPKLKAVEHTMGDGFLEVHVHRK